VEALKAKMIDVALNHHGIGIGKVLVPKSFAMLQEELRGLNAKYLKWDEYAALGKSVDIHIRLLSVFTLVFTFVFRCHSIPFPLPFPLLPLTVFKH
jgi:hypothetical protein